MRKLLFIFSLLALLLSACNSNLFATPIPANAPELGITDPSKPIEVAAGSEFTITVRVDLPPEYHWEEAEALDPKVVAFVSKDYIADDADPNAKGRDVWRFKAVAPGKTTITLGYYEGMTVNAARMPVFTVIVK